MEEKQEENVQLIRTKRRLSRSNLERNPSQPFVYLQFKKDIESGKFEATDEDVKRLVLIPHFDPPDLDLTGELENTTTTARRKINKPKQLSNKEFFDIQNKSKTRAEIIYDRRMKQYYDRVRDSTKMLDGRSNSSAGSIKAMAFTDAQKDKLQESLARIKKHVQSIQQQNEALSQHLLLLNTAKKQLLLNKNCLIQSTEWERGEIEKYKASLERHQRMSPR